MKKTAVLPQDNPSIYKRLPSKQQQALLQEPLFPLQVSECVQVFRRQGNQQVNE